MGWIRRGRGRLEIPEVRWVADCKLCRRGKEGKEEELRPAC